MFSRRSAAIEQPQPALVRPEPQTPEHAVVPIGSYEELAGELGFMPAQLLQEQLLRFLAEQNIPVFDFDRVFDFMTALTKRMAKEQNEDDLAWFWRPLRKADKTGHRWDGGGDRGYVTWKYGFYNDNSNNCRPYHRLVPIHILRHARTIEDRFGEQLKFFVSDIAVVDPDPFIMAWAVDMPPVVFGVWDEPGFGLDE